MKEISILGIDLAKSVFHVVGMDARGRIKLKRKLTRSEVAKFISSYPPLTVAMESCASSHYWGRLFLSYGHEVKLIAPQFVKPYVKSNKNDLADAEAIAEASSRPTMRLVSIKSIEQQDLQSLHRVRARLVSSRTALVNEMRGLLSEYGIVLPQGRKKFVSDVPHRLAQEAESLSVLAKELFDRLYQELRGLEQEIKFYEDKLSAICNAHPECQRLLTSTGIGVMTATAFVSAVGDVSKFKNGRQLAAWLGLVPRQYTTGGKPRLGGISKRGDRYLRKLLVQGAMSVLRHAEGKLDARSILAIKLRERLGTKKAAVAIANRTARTAWALLSKQEDYKLYPVAA